MILLLKESYYQQKNKEKICIDGFIYNKNKNRIDLYYWVCEKSGKKGNSCECAATANTLYANNKHIVRKHDRLKHNHAPEASNSEVLKICNKIKELAVNSNEKPGIIIRDVNAEVKKCIRTYLPKNKNLTEQIRYARRKSKAKEPQNISELHLPQELTKTLDGEQFGRIIKEGTQCIILFTTYENLKILVKSNCWLMDGTFKALPTFMKQLYTIHANIKDDDCDNNTVIPLVYALLSSKRQNIYILLLQNLVSLAEELGRSPEFILINFEIAAINAIKTVFPNTKLKGCFFSYLPIYIS